ncbi:MAG: hypothetical protein IAE78_17065 [Myxococcus sp.]|nr:hypothetical protein [Myxococcus sp.]
MTIAELFPGNMGRVWMTRVALRLRMPELMKLVPSTTLEAELQRRLAATLDEVKRG